MPEDAVAAVQEDTAVGPVVFVAQVVVNPLEVPAVQDDTGVGPVVVVPQVVVV